jgi:hypothetical protein
MEFGEDCDGPLGTSVLGLRMPETNVFSTSRVHLQYPPCDAARNSAGSRNNVDGFSSNTMPFRLWRRKGVLPSFRASEHPSQGGARKGDRSTAASAQATDERLNGQESPEQTKCMRRGERYNGCTEIERRKNRKKKTGEQRRRTTDTKQRMKDRGKRLRPRERDDGPRERERDTGQLTAKYTPRGLQSTACAH